MTEDTTDRDAWARFVTALRARRHWSRRHMGSLLDVPESSLRNWERGSTVPIRRFRRALLALDLEYPGDPNDLPDTKSA